MYSTINLYVLKDHQANMHKQADDNKIADESQKRKNIQQLITSLFFGGVVLGEEREATSTFSEYSHLKKYNLDENTW